MTMGPEFALIVVVCALLGGGAGLGLLIGMSPSTWLQWAGFTGVAYTLGVCIFIISAQFLISIGLPSWSALLVLAACGLPLFVHPFGKPRAVKIEKPDLVAIGIFALLVLVILILGSIVVVKNELYVWDAWGIWTRKAVILADSLEPYFSSKDYIFMKPDYPIGLPALQAAVFSVAGETGTKTGDWPIWLMVPAGVTAIAYLAPARARFWVPVVAATLVLPLFTAQTLSGYVDVPGALLIAVAVLSGGRWLIENENWQLSLSALMIGGAICVKNESMLIGLIVLVLLTVLNHREWRRLAWAWALALFALIPWRVWMADKGIEGDLPLKKALDPGYMIDNVDRPWRALGDLLNQVTFSQGGLRAVLLTVVVISSLVLLISHLGRRDARLVVLALVGSSASLLFAYWISPHDLDWHLLNSSDRVIVTPVLVLLSGVLLVLDPHQPSRGTPAKAP
jgi:hypothetical protein